MISNHSDPFAKPREVSLQSQATAQRWTRTISRTSSSGRRWLRTSTWPARRSPTGWLIWSRTTSMLTSNLKFCFHREMFNAMCDWHFVLAGPRADWPPSADFGAPSGRPRPSWPSPSAPSSSSGGCSGPAGTRRTKTFSDAWHSLFPENWVQFISPTWTIIVYISKQICLIYPLAPQ